MQMVMLCCHKRLTWRKSLVSALRLVGYGFDSSKIVPIASMQVLCNCKIHINLLNKNHNEIALSSDALTQSILSCTSLACIQ